MEVASALVEVASALVEVTSALVEVASALMEVASALVAAGLRRAQSCMLGLSFVFLTCFLQGSVASFHLARPVRVPRNAPDLALAISHAVPLTFALTSPSTSPSPRRRSCLSTSPSRSPMPHPHSSQIALAGT